MVATSTNITQNICMLLACKKHVRLMALFRVRKSAKIKLDEARRWATQRRPRGSSRPWFIVADVPEA
jgi:hypothetical protein